MNGHKQVISVHNEPKVDINQIYGPLAGREYYFFRLMYAKSIQ